MVNFAETLKQLRTEAGLTQTELAKRLHVTKSTISYYEMQERAPSPELLIKLAAFFHVTTDYLLGVGHEKLIDVSDLDEEDISFLLITIEMLRKKHKK